MVTHCSVLFFSTERFQLLCVPFHQEAAEVNDIKALSVVREEHLSLLYQSAKKLKMDIRVTNEIETVDLKPHGCLFSSSLSFHIDEEKKVAVCGEKVIYNKIYIVGEDKYTRYIDLLVSVALMVG